MGYIFQRNAGCIYLGSMEIQFETLRLLASLVSEAPQPTQYQCLPRQMILLSNYDWTLIYAHLLELEKDGLVQIGKADNIQFSITEEGLRKAIEKELIDSIPNKNSPLVGGEFYQ